MSSQQDSTLTTVHSTRAQLWQTAFERLTDELEASGSISVDLLRRLKLVDERLGVLFGDRVAKGPQVADESPVEAPDGLRRYRVTG